MAMNNQVEEIALESTHFTNGNANSNQRYDLRISDYDISIDPEFYDEEATDRSLGGALRTNLRSVRPTASLSYESSLQSSRFRDLVNDIIVAFVDNDADSIDFYPDASKTDKYGVIITDQLSLLTTYNNTVGHFEPSIELIAKDELTVIPEYLEAP